ncbi:hypothetical protein BH11PLA1_BH11PLA1_02940 [soil metagenome]
MPTYRLQGTDEFQGLPREIFVRAESAADAAALMAERGIASAKIDEVEAAPAGAGVVQRPTPPPPTSARRRRVRLVMLGIALALYAIAGVLFVIKAKEHIQKKRDPLPPTWERDQYAPVVK